MRRIVLTIALTAAGLASALPAAAASEPVIHLDISRSVQAVNYKMSISTSVPLLGTELIPRAEGKAKIATSPGNTQIAISLKGMVPATKFGASLTYVLWALTPEGRTSNLGELQLSGGNADMKATTRLNSFALIVTAEPYFAVAVPSEMVVVENIPDKDVKGTIQQVTASQELFSRGRYAGLQPQTIDPSGEVPMDLYQARSAIQMARLAEAEKYAPEAWAKVQKLMQTADADMKSPKASLRGQVGGIARQAVQASEDARGIATKLAEQARVEAEMQAEAQRQATDAAKAKAALESANSQRAAAEKATAEAKVARESADAQRAVAEKATAEAQQQALEAQKHALAMQQQAAQAEEAKAAADEARSAAMAAELLAQAQAEAATKSKEQLRAQLLAQFNQVLPTQDTPRGLVVNLGGVNFATNSAELTVDAREKLARFSGLIAPYPGLIIAVEGYTDNTGSSEINLKLSQARANSVRDYLIPQGVKPESISANGLGDAMPVADNATAKGRAQNRRVEIVVSGEVIGTKIGPQ